MSPDRSKTRRQILLSLGGLGTLSAVGGASTAAYFSDREAYRNGIRAGQVDISIDCEGCSIDDGGVEMSFDTINPGEQRDKRFRIAVEDDSNPIRLWLRTECPPALDPLGEALETRLSIERNCTGDPERLYPADEDWASLDELRRALSDGLRLDDPASPCVDAGTTYCFRLEYRLPSDATWAVEADSTLTFAFYAQQCRNVSEDQVDGGPYAETTCPQIECPDCVELGKVEVESQPLSVDTVYSFDELASPFDSDDHEYALEILTLTDKVSEDERETVCAGFRLLRDGSEEDAPALCSAAMAGGRPQGDPSDPDSRRVTYEVTPPLTRTRGKLCAAHDKDDPASEPDGERPGISHITVYVCPDSAGGGSR
jgi:predicted ribosomally synthesized peptide with SipW-like signal peptide